MTDSGASAPVGQPGAKGGRDQGGRDGRPNRDDGGAADAASATASIVGSAASALPAWLLWKAVCTPATSPSVVGEAGAAAKGGPVSAGQAAPMAPGGAPALPGPVLVDHGVAKIARSAAGPGAGDLFGGADPTANAGVAAAIISAAFDDALAAATSWRGLAVASPTAPTLAAPPPAAAASSSLGPSRALVDALLPLVATPGGEAVAPVRVAQTSVRLDPPGLGTVEVGVRTQAGTVQLVVRCQQAATVDALRAEAPLLRQALAGVGLRLDDYKIEPRHGTSSKSASDDESSSDTTSSDAEPDVFVDAVDAAS